MKQDFDMSECNKLNMTMVSVFYDASINPLRKSATKKAVECWMKQRSLPKEMMFIELGFNGVFTFSKEDFPEQIDYIRIDGNDSHKYLFQKEHLWNIAAKQAKYQKLMFVDSDIAPLTNVDWFRKVYVTLDRCLFAQGFGKIQYLDSSNHTIETKSSYAHSFVASGTTSGVPGGVYCVKKAILDEIGGFNYLPFGGGDDLFWYELLGKTNVFPQILTTTKRDEVQTKIHSMTKSMKVNLIECIDINICHFYHGEMANRSYIQRQVMLLTQYPWIGRIMKDDEQGLLSWIDMNHYFYNVASKIHIVNNDVRNASRLFSGKIDYLRFFHMIEPKYNSKYRFKTHKEMTQFIMDSVKKCQVINKKRSYNDFSRFQFG